MINTAMYCDMSHTDVSLKMNSKLNSDRRDRWSAFWFLKTFHFTQNRPAGLLNCQKVMLHCG